MIARRAYPFAITSRAFFLFISPALSPSPAFPTVSARAELLPWLFLPLLYALTQADWEALAERVRIAGVKFIIEPYTRFKGEVGEQSTMFFLDPSGNALEFKAFADLSQLFAK